MLLCLLSLIAATALATTCHAQFDTIINVPPDVAPNEIGSNTQLNLFDGGTVSDSFQAGMPDGSRTNIEVNITGGTVGDHFDAHFGTRINILGGAVGRIFDALPGSEVTISGGTVDFGLHALAGSKVTILDGTVDGLLRVDSGAIMSITGGTIQNIPGLAGNIAETGSHVSIAGGTVEQLISAGNLTISGGTLGSVFLGPGSEASITGGIWRRNLRFDEESQARVSGGFFESNFSTRSAGQITLVGGEFHLDGLPVEGLDAPGATLTFDDLPHAELSGTLADGTPFRSVISSGGHWTLEAADLPPIGPPLIVASQDDVPFGIRDGQTLLVDAGSVIDGLWAGRGSTVIIEEGSAIHSLRTEAASARIAGGDINGLAFAYGISIAGRLEAAATDVFLSAGSVESLDLVDGSQAVITGGSIETLEVAGGSQVVMTGGSITDRLHVTRVSAITISGGTILAEASVDVRSSSTIDLFGTEFHLDGVEIDMGPLGNAVTIVDRRPQLELAGKLADGSRFTFDLQESNLTGGDVIFPSATLTVTRVSLLDGDYNSNGTVDQADLDLVLLNWGEELFNPFAAGWINDLPSGPIDQQELDGVLLNWGNTSAAAVTTASVPEPSTCALLIAFATVAGTLARSTKGRVIPE